MRLRPLPRSTSTSVVSSMSRLSCGVSVPRTSDSVAKALMIKLTGEVTFFLSSPTCH